MVLHLRIWGSNKLLSDCCLTYAFFTASFSSLFHKFSQRMRKICFFREAKYQNFPGGIPSDPPSLLVPSALNPILTGPTLNCFRRACICRGNSHIFGVRKHLNFQPIGCALSMKFESCDWCPAPPSSNGFFAALVFGSELPNGLLFEIAAGFIHRENRLHR